MVGVVPVVVVDTGGVVVPGAVVVVTENRELQMYICKEG